MRPLNHVLIRSAELPGYGPANHTGTVNKRLISPKTNGSKHIEMVLGSIEKGHGGAPHSHPGMEQACYLLAGTAHVECAGHSFEIQAGDCFYFPPDEEHIFEVTSDEPVKVLIVYSPAYEERPELVHRRTQ
jgi:quercetin dioxygenase-like cupin family protein